MKEFNASTFKEIVQDCSLNFLIGSGMSAPYLSALGNIEILLTEIDRLSISGEVREVLRGSVYKKYCDDVIFKNLEILNDEDLCRATLASYKSFVLRLNSLLLERKSSILSRQINVFTTNIDIFFEKALESCRLECNDGFLGRFAPVFDLSSFKKSYIKKSDHYDNISEIPVFNLLKLHGSLTWRMAESDSEIIYDTNLAKISELKRLTIDSRELLEIHPTDDAASLFARGRDVTPRTICQFLEQFEELPIVNPTKEKFWITLLNETYYDLLRMYSNELEKENSVLFVLGFSFADEHIRHLTLRAANSNPTLAIHVFAYTSKAKEDIKKTFRNEALKYDNLAIWSPNQIEESATMVDEFEFNFDNIQRCVFQDRGEAGDAIRGVSI